MEDKRVRLLNSRRHCLKYGTSLAEILRRFQLSDVNSLLIFSSDYKLILFQLLSRTLLVSLSDMQL